MARLLGEFVGHVVQGLRADVTEKRTSERLVLKSEVVEDAPLESPAGKITLRRTTIEEVEIDRPAQAEDR